MLNLFAPSNCLGVGTHATNFGYALERAGIEICLVPPFGSVSVQNESINRWLKNRETFDPKNPSLMIFDSGFLTQFCGNPRIGFAVFETDDFDPIQLAAIRSCDVVVTPSEWGRRVLKIHGVESQVVNEGYDPEQFKVQPTPTGTIKFCHIGKHEQRKGGLQVLDCFFKALENEDAYLEMHCENPFSNNWFAEIFHWLNSLGFRWQGTGISFQSVEVQFGTWRRAGLTIKICASQSENLAAVYAGSDCGIFPSKGEGWGLPILECLATGVPAIVGNWTGQSEFLGDTYPKELTLENYHSEPANDGIWYHGNRGNWNVPKDDELTIKIQWAYKYIREFRSTERWAREVARLREYTWDAAAVAFKEKVLYK